MTNDQALVNLIAVKIILGAVLTTLVGAPAAADLVAGDTPVAATDGASLVGKYIANKAVYDGAPTTFVATPANVDALDVIVDGLGTITVGNVAEVSATAYADLQTASPD
jgi:hypothetical protein